MIRKEAASSAILGALGGSSLKDFIHCKRDERGALARPRDAGMEE